MVRSSLVLVAALLAFAVPAFPPVGGGMAANAASPGFPAGALTLTMFGSDEAPSFQVEEGLIAEWQKLHPNVAVQAQQAPLGPSFQKLSTQLPSGGRPRDSAGHSAHVGAGRRPAEETDEV